MPGDSDAEYASPWAGAAVLPFSEKSEAAQYWDADSWREFKKLADEVPESGVSWQGAVVYVRHDDRSMDWFLGPDSREGKEKGKPWFVDALPGYKVSAPETNMTEYIKAKLSFTTITINPALYLPYLLSHCLKSGVVFRRAILTHIADASTLHHTGAKADLLVNCTGLGAAALGGVRDSAVFPARGQVVLVRNYPEKLLTMAGPDGDEDTYMIPRPAGGGTVLGGSYQPEDWNADPDMDLAGRIMQRGVELDPTLAGGKGVESLSVVRHGVGFRPARTGGPRVEAEWVGELAVVHNYGHGGGGYQASWGCAAEAVRLVGGFLKG